MVATGRNIVHANGETFEEVVVKSKMPALVDFWAPWCAPCHVITPIIEDLSRDYTGRVKFVKVNVDEAQNVAMSLGIMSIPTIAIFTEGQVRNQLIGVQPKAALERMIEDSLKRGA
jgi:thioredoxin 1